MRQLLSSGGAAWIAGSIDTQDGATRLVPGNDEIQNRSRGALVRPSFANHDDAKKDSLPSSKREAERRKAHANHVRVCANKCARTCATHPYAAARPFGARPPFGAHACGTRHRLSPRWLIARTGFPADEPRRCFARLAQLSSVKHAPCRPVFLPVDRGPRAARERIGNSARGHRPSLPSFRLALPERRPQ
jgi:hypothetical protein